MSDTIYVGSDGRCYTAVELWERLESGSWQPCCWDPESGDEWVETADGELLALSPVDERELPDDIEIKTHPRGRLIDGERELPARAVDGDPPNR